MERVSPSERLRRKLEDALAGVGHEQDPIEVVGRLGARLILQQALEAEVDQVLGRARYERAEEVVAYRNGYELRTVQTASGPVQLSRQPRVRNAGELGFASRILGQTVIRTHALEALVISGFLRGLSTRDVERCSRRRSTSVWWARARSAASARISVTATRPGAVAAWQPTTSCTCSWTRSTCACGRRMSRPRPSWSRGG